MPLLHWIGRTILRVVLTVAAVWLVLRGLLALSGNGVEIGPLLFFAVILSPLLWSNALWSFVTFGLLGNRRK